MATGGQDESAAILEQERLSNQDRYEARGKQSGGLSAQLSQEKSQSGAKPEGYKSYFYEVTGPKVHGHVRGGQSTLDATRAEAQGRIAKLQGYGTVKYYVIPDSTKETKNLISTEKWGTWPPGATDNALGGLGGDIDVGGVALPLVAVGLVVLIIIVIMVGGAKS